MGGGNTGKGTNPFAGSGNWDYGMDNTVSTGGGRQMTDYSTPKAQTGAVDTGYEQYQTNQLKQRMMSQYNSGKEMWGMGAGEQSDEYDNAYSLDQRLNFNNQPSLGKDYDYEALIKEVMANAGKYPTYGNVIASQMSYRDGGY